MFKRKKKRFYTAGYEDGYAHGRLHGLIEGRALGAEKGFELWEELGFYEGAARLWAAVFSTDSNGTDACVPLPSSLPARAPDSVADPLCLPSRSFLFPLIDAVPTTRPHYSP
jgi:Essential protein Yae1, N terminal